MVEAQPFLGALRDQVQAEAQPCQHRALALERGGLVQAQVAEPDQRVDVAHAERAQRHPAQGVEVAQAAGAILDVRFQVVGGVTEPLVAQQQFLALGQEVVARRPDQGRRYRARQRLLRPRGDAQRSCLDQRGEHGLVGCGLHALRGRAHRMAGRQPGVPQQREQPRQRGLAGLLHVRLAQDQQVDVRAREQFAAAVTADREQRQAVISGQAAPPGLLDQLVDAARAQRQQPLDVVALLEAPAQPRIGLGQRLPRRGRPLRVARGVGRRVRYVLDQIRRQWAHAAPDRACSASAGDSVSTSTPSSVTATMCSHCAESLRSLVTTVQPSGSTLV